MATNSRRSNKRKTANGASPPNKGGIPRFTDERVALLMGIASKAGLPEEEIDAFKNWLSGIPCFATAALGHADILTRPQRRKLFSRALQPLRRAINILANECPENYLRSYHHKFVLNELEQEGRPLTNEQVNSIGARFGVELGQLKRWQTLLEFAIESVDKNEPNSDELAKANPAYRASENILLETILQAWKDRFKCRVTISRSSPLVQFCVEVFDAIGWRSENDEPHDAMRKRLRDINRRKAGTQNAKMPPPTPQG